MWKALVEKVAVTASEGDSNGLKKNGNVSDTNELTQAHDDFQLLFSTLYAIARGDTIAPGQPEITVQPFKIPSASRPGDSTWLTSLLVLFLQGALEALPSSILLSDSDLKVPSFFARKNSLGAIAPPSLALLQLHTASVAVDTTWASEFAESLRILANKAVLLDNLAFIVQLLPAFPASIVYSLYEEVVKSLLEVDAKNTEVSLINSATKGISDVLLFFHRFGQYFDSQKSTSATNSSRLLIAAYSLSAIDLQRLVEVFIASIPSFD